MNAFDKPTETTNIIRVVSLCVKGGCCPDLVFYEDGSVAFYEDGKTLLTLSAEQAAKTAQAIWLASKRRG